MEEGCTQDVVHDDAVRNITLPFSQWAMCVHAESLASPTKLHEEGSSSPPFYRTRACVLACCCFLRAMNTHGDGHLGKLYSKQLVSDGVYRLLGEGTAADWEGISKWLAKRAGMQTHDPAWLQDRDNPQQSITSICDRLGRACCSSEVAVLMLRLAVRPACLCSSWYGPWEDREALLQLIGTKALESLLQALRALLGTFGADLAKQYNALNIVNDILHVSPQHSPPSLLGVCPSLWM